MKAFKGAFTSPGDYVYFKSQVPLHKIPIGTKQWRYYDFGPKVVPPLICLPGTAGTADVYYKQVMALSMKGYHVISVDIPRVWNYQEWIQAFEKFLDALDVHHVHIYGTSLGGFLAQLFAQHRPRRVRSLFLSNTFLDTHTFSAAMPWVPVVSWMPSFLLKRYVLTGIRSGPHEPFIADSVDFVVSQVETLSKDDLASRLTLTVDSTSIGPLLLSDAFITIMDTNDYCAIPQECKDEVGERYPGARRADLKSGGDFPFLSRPDEVNLHLQLHLRRAGVEPCPDLVAVAAIDYSSRGIPTEETEVETNPAKGPSENTMIDEQEEDQESISNEGNDEDEQEGSPRKGPFTKTNDYDLGSSSMSPKEDTNKDEESPNPNNDTQENGDREDLDDSDDMIINHPLPESRNAVAVE